MVQKQKSNTREEYIVQIGPLLMKALQKQIESIREATYYSVKPSNYEAGEIIAKKFLGEA